MKHELQSVDFIHAVQTPGGFITNAKATHKGARVPAVRLTYDVEHAVVFVDFDGKPDLFVPIANVKGMTLARPPSRHGKTEKPMAGEGLEVIPAKEPGGYATAAVSAEALAAPHEHFTGEMKKDDHDPIALIDAPPAEPPKTKTTRAPRQPKGQKQK